MASQLYLTTSAITCASASLSVLSGLAIIWSYRQFPQLQNFTRYLLVCLTVADIFTAYGNFISTFRWLSNGNIGTKNDGFCIVQSFITTTSALSSFFWTTTIAIYLYSAVALRANIAKKLGTRVLMTLIPIFVPVTITSVALGYGALGEDDYSGSGPWCWINSDVNNRLMWKVVAGKGWEILTYIITLVIYILLKFFKWRETADVHPGETIADILLYIQCFGDSSQAFWNFVFFFTLDPELREHIYHRKYCLRRRDASAVRINE
ncbi:G-protein coupled receptor 157-like isoform X2 [Pecten maximus]|uniref:G-protein coupled receptor 157-like isoform X2 n=1 Tax=Pecten maximus TaxID=6579 RepID=UPI00145817C4|nr:G-protein coupled receptor 157-like isoform X2 [Pecten maximus]